MKEISIVTDCTQIYPVSEGYLRIIPVEKRGKYPGKQEKYFQRNVFLEQNQNRINHGFALIYNM